MENANHFKSLQWLITIVLVVALCFSLVACAGDVGNPVAIDTATPKPTATPTPSPTSVPTPGPEEYCFARCMVRMRMVKNDYFNKLYSAMEEDPSFAAGLYWMLDFIYGDDLFDLFAEFGRDDDAFIGALLSAGYSNPVFVDKEDGSRMVAATNGGVSCELVALYDEPTDSGLISVTVGGVVDRYVDWVRIDGGYALQYMRMEYATVDDETTPTGYYGYRIQMYDDGDGQMCYGTYCEGDILPIFADPSKVDDIWYFKVMHTYNMYRVLDGVLSLRINGKPMSRVIGEPLPTEIPQDYDPDCDEPIDEPIDTETP